MSDVNPWTLWTEDVLRSTDDSLPDCEKLLRPPEMPASPEAAFSPVDDGDKA